MQIFSVVLIILGLFVQGLFTEEVREALGLTDTAQCPPAVAACTHRSHSTDPKSGSADLSYPPSAVVDVVERRLAPDAAHGDNDLQSGHLDKTDDERHHVMSGALSNTLASPGRITLDPDA